MLNVFGEQEDKAHSVTKNCETRNLAV